MDILVRVLAKRKCHSSLDWDDDKEVFVMSFGDKIKPETDVEVEFTTEQLEKHLKMLQKSWDNTHGFSHAGEC